MKTITFYSYKGGTGRSLALANAARYLARLEFKVVALDFDLEAPGLHYKFSSNPEGNPLKVVRGVVDYLHQFCVEGEVPKSIRDFTVDVPVPGSAKPLIQLIPAGAGPSKEYWSKLSQINWHELFYSKDAKGVQLFLDLKARIADELAPDFLLIDSRTGITEMGGVATTILADRVIALVLPSVETLEGTRAVLRSVRRTRRELDGGELELMVALSRLPQMKEMESDRQMHLFEGRTVGSSVRATDTEHAWTERIRNTLNEEAEDLRDTLSCSEVFVLHSESALQLRESLRVGGDVSPDDSILLRDYLRLFPNVVPQELIDPKVTKLIEQARQKIWHNPEAALKEVEELAESFGHPSNYRALLQFYQVRNVTGAPVLKRAQRLWELTRDANEPILWQILVRTFEPKARWRRESEWLPDLAFVEAVWRNAGGKSRDFGMQLAHAYNLEDRESRAADILLEVIAAGDPDAETVARCISFLDVAKRTAEADTLIQQLKSKLSGEARFVEAWARHALRDNTPGAVSELLHPPVLSLLEVTRPMIAALVYARSGLIDLAESLAEKALSDIRERGPGTERELREAATLFQSLGKFEQFEEAVSDRIPSHTLDEFRKPERRRRRP